MLDTHRLSFTGVLEPNGNWVASPADGSSVRDHQTQMLQSHRAVG